MVDPVSAPTSSVASDQVKSVPTLEDRIATLEKDVAVLKEAANSYGGKEWIVKIEQRLAKIDGGR